MSLRARCVVYGTETAITIGRAASWSRTQPRGVIFCHGSGGTAAETQAEPNHRRLFYGLADSATVQSGDWGLQSFGNDAAVSLVGDGVARLRADWGVTGPVALVGISMGCCTALNYAVRNPGEVSAVAGVLGLTDLGRAYDDYPDTLAHEIDTAYGGTFTAADRTAHSPIAFAAGLPAAMPICLWTASDDTTVPPDTHTAFLAARPQTERQWVPSPAGHSAVSVGHAAEDVIKWVAART